MLADHRPLQTAPPLRRLPQMFSVMDVAERARQFLQRPRPQSHLVQFYGSDNGLMNSNVGCFLAGGLTLGGAVVIGSPQRNQAVALEISKLGPKLGIDAQQAEAQGRVRFLDAEETLARFMVGGEPYWGRFEHAISAVIGEIREAVGHGVLRAYGEMVGVLWTQRQHAAAIRVEQFWNKLLARSSASLFCGYPIDLASPASVRGPVDAILCTHTHLIPPQSCEDQPREIPARERQFLPSLPVKM